ncbi:hypothetical protein OQA88_8255 [Cercophora sp. LCS_1]
MSTTTTNPHHCTLLSKNGGPRASSVGGTYLVLRRACYLKESYGILRDVNETIDDIEIHAARLNLMKKRVYGQASDLSSPETAKLGILDLPDEILLMILKAAYTDRTRQVHEKYKALYDKQEHVYGDSGFSTWITTIHAGPMSLTRDIWDGLRDFMLEPLPGNAVVAYGAPLPITGTLLRFLDAARAAGVLLQSIKMDLGTLGEPGSLRLTPGTEDTLHLGMTQLEQFHFVSNRLPDPRKHRRQIQRLLARFVSTSNLRELTLDGRNKNSFAPNIRLQRILHEQHRWHRLLYLRLRYVDLRAQTLSRLVGDMSRPFCYFSLARVRLVEGEWKHVLDLVRNRGVESLYFRDPIGAECKNMGMEARSRQFRDVRVGSTLVERYMPGGEFPDGNPLKDFENEQDAEDEMDWSDGQNGQVNWIERRMRELGG